MKTWCYITICSTLAVATLPAGAEDGGGFRISPPAVAPLERARDVINTDLRGLTDAYGMALLVQDDKAAGKIGKVLKKWRDDYDSLLGSDPVLGKIDSRMRGIFSKMLGDRYRPVAGLVKMLSKAPKEKIRPIVLKWLRSLLYDKGVYFAADLDNLDKGALTEICVQARAMDSLKGLPSWRYRFLTWLYRDRQVKELFRERDERLVFIAPVRIKEGSLDKSSKAALKKYLAMVRNLRLQVLRDKTLPYDQYRTVDGLIRGLRYMDTIRHACELTGLDHRLMTRLFIQESEFIHQRVSWAGAFSLAQFLNIALKDVWLFKKRIPGSKSLLDGIGSYEEMRSRVIADPRMAIKVSCLYFRRIRDEVIMRLGRKGRRPSREMTTLLTLELFSLREGTSESSTLDAITELGQNWPLREMIMLPLVPMTGGLMPDAGVMLAGWMERTIRDLVQLRLARGVFEKRLGRLHSALGLAAYNAGMGNLVKTSKARSPFGSLSFPLQISETRNYIDDILDGRDILDRVDRLASEVAMLGYESVIDLTEKACAKVGMARKNRENEDQK